MIMLRTRSRTRSRRVSIELREHCLLVCVELPAFYVDPIEKKKAPIATRTPKIAIDDASYGAT